MTATPWNKDMPKCAFWHVYPNHLFCRSVFCFLLNKARHGGSAPLSLKSVQQVGGRQHRVIAQGQCLSLDRNEINRLFSLHHSFLSNMYSVRHGLSMVLIIYIQIRSGSIPSKLHSQRQIQKWVSAFPTLWQRLCFNRIFCWTLWKRLVLTIEMHLILLVYTWGQVSFRIYMR